MAVRGLSLIRQSKWTEAEPVLRECLAIREKAQPDEWSTFNTRSLLGDSLLGQKKYAEAEPLIVSGYEGMKAREAKIPAPACRASRRVANVSSGFTRSGARRTRRPNGGPGWRSPQTGPGTNPETAVQEVFAVTVLPGRRYPDLINDDEKLGSGDRVPGTPYTIPALWLGLSRATERGSTLPRPQSKNHIFALQQRWISSVMTL